MTHERGIVIVNDIKENDKRTKARLKDDKNGSVGCRFIRYLSLIFLFMGPIINNKIKNKKWKKQLKYLRLLFSLFETLSTYLFNPLHSFSFSKLRSLPSVFHTFLTPSPPFFTRSFLYSSPSPSNAASSNRTRPQCLLMIDLQRSYHQQNNRNEQTSPPFESSLKSRLTLSISQNVPDSKQDTAQRFHHVRVYDHRSSHILRSPW